MGHFQGNGGFAGRRRSRRPRSGAACPWLSDRSCPLELPVYPGPGVTFEDRPARGGRSGAGAASLIWSIRASASTSVISLPAMTALRQAIRARARRIRSMGSSWSASDSRSATSSISSLGSRSGPEGPVRRRPCRIGRPARRAPLQSRIPPAGPDGRPGRPPPRGTGRSRR